MVNFINVFLSYFVLVVIFAAVGFVAVKIGIALRKKKDRKQAALVADNQKVAES
jgi:predicted membrane protein